MQDAKAERNQVKAARRLVEKVRGRLMHPTIEALDHGGAELTAAVNCLAGLERAFAGSPGSGQHWPGLAAEVACLRLEVRRVQDLLQGAAKFYAGWARLIAPDLAPANYTPEGKAEPRATGELGEVVLHG
ncbi:MAG TPA: hypothetical protein VMB25_12500 [Bryobacteraceae bacterium]|nr:hypothetical protein [Bryobacteraceae bacterium]